MKTKTLHVLAVLMICMLGLVSMSYSSEVNDEKLVEMAQRELKAHLESRPTASGWIVTANPANKMVETNWYSDHKGEVILKVEVRIHDGLIRVDALQRTGLIFHSDIKTDWSRSTEWNVQKRIEKAKATIK